MKDSSCQSDGPRFFYNSTRSRCQRLVGGCGSNNNTFKTLESCQTLCYGNGNSDFNILFGIIVLMVVFMVIVTFVAFVVLVVQYCRRASSNGSSVESNTDCWVLVRERSESVSVEGDTIGCVCF
ncbi:hypothetical protein PFLUV_G00015470 [Perca fluviatilis]|uniref:BPTI/Kunitz inhibitor domain-containing protein n=1 Tax=Perca fluviatilis TaxID=8168 RepID=A0A6A5FMZ7_PERFL|nr:hypothetical protein PFLUV_G00015470 [Perca fluviatilis]